MEVIWMYDMDLILEIAIQEHSKARRRQWSLAG